MPPWILSQRWHDLLFAHWPLPAAELRAAVPPALSLETCEGSAWISVVALRMSGIRFRRMPPVPGLSAFRELNVRTYVTGPAGPGVWFLSLDAGSRAAVAVARRWFRLPYYRARLLSEVDGEGFSYRSRRTHRGAPPAEFAAWYAPAGPKRTAAPGSLDHWLVERYALYAADPEGRPLAARIAHEPWPLQTA
ncbi:MAG: YqjF family protein, partial [Planctomycetota bacterium]